MKRLFQPWALLTLALALSMATPQSTRAQTVTILHSFFDGSVYNDGQNPSSTLVQGADGTFYGMIYSGGATFDIDPQGNGYGTIFSVTPNGAETVLHSFNGYGGMASDLETAPL